MGLHRVGVCVLMIAKSRYRLLKGRMKGALCITSDIIMYDTQVWLVDGCFKFRVFGLTCNGVCQCDRCVPSPTTLLLMPSH